MIYRPTTGRAAIRLPALSVAPGTLEALKWLGLLLMTGDHINKYLFNGTLPALFEAGRLAMPLFVFVLAINLARYDQLESGGYTRVIKRLAIFGGFATVPFVALGGLAAGWWPLNILFTLLVFTATTRALDEKKYLVSITWFVIGGALVEFWWPAILFGLGVWSYTRTPSIIAAGVAIAGCFSLAFINGNLWAMAAIPLLLLATQIDLKVPRFRWTFYVYYPLHLGLIWLARIPMSEAGYLFF